MKASNIAFLLIYLSLGIIALELGNQFRERIIPNYMIQVDGFNLSGPNATSLILWAIHHAFQIHLLSEKYDVNPLSLDGSNYRLYGNNLPYNYTKYGVNSPVVTTSDMCQTTLAFNKSPAIVLIGTNVTMSNLCLEFVNGESWNI